jgi:hypothetical protein
MLVSELSAARKNLRPLGGRKLHDVSYGLVEVTPSYSGGMRRKHLE